MSTPEAVLPKTSEQIAALERQLNILKAERAAHIMIMHRAGKSLAQIGKVAGLTRQRVLQIIQRYEGPNAAG